ncbi:hypothetical protein SALBM311S_11038 [Streptomyces alboniger]
MRSETRTRTSGSSEKPCWIRVAAPAAPARARLTRTAAPLTGVPDASSPMLAPGCNCVPASGSTIVSLGSRPARSIIRIRDAPNIPYRVPISSISSFGGPSSGTADSLPTMFMVPPAIRPTPSASIAMSSRNAWATLRSAPALSPVTCASSAIVRSRWGADGSRDAPRPVPSKNSSRGRCRLRSFFSSSRSAASGGLPAAAVLPAAGAFPTARRTWRSMR